IPWRGAVWALGSKSPIGPKCRDCTNENDEKVEPHPQTSFDLIDRLTDHVFIQLDRAWFDGGNKKFIKVDHKVEIPVEADMGPYTFAKAKAMYDLAGVMDHTASNVTTPGGHYLSCVRTEGNTWRLFSDKVVKTVQLAEVLTKDAAILWYARRA
ncbi:unnamed protein product, partial [Laminaria digitata]